MSQKKRSLAVLIGILGVILLAGACHKKQVATPPPPPPPPPPPAPTVTLTAEPSTIEKGQSVTLSWTFSECHFPGFAARSGHRPGPGVVERFTE